MHRRLLPSLVIAAALATPNAARADWALRAAYLVPMYVNTGVSQTLGAPIYTYGVGQQWISNLDVLASWYPVDFMSVDIEGQFNLTGTNPNYPMTGIYVGPGVTFDFPLFLYARVALPVQVSGQSNYPISTPTAFLRRAEVSSSTSLSCGCTSRRPPTLPTLAPASASSARRPSTLRLASG